MVYLNATNYFTNMWSRLSTLQNTMAPDGFIDKSYVKLSTKRIFTAMILHVVQSIILSVLWITTRSTWSIVMNIPFTFLETAWFVNEIRKGWHDIDQHFWDEQTSRFPTTEFIETSRVEPMFIQPDVSMHGVTDTVEQLLQDIGDDIEPMQIEELSFLSREK